jgi:hypothetical protein
MHVSRQPAGVDAWRQEPCLPSSSMRPPRPNSRRAARNAEIRGSETPRCAWCTARHIITRALTCATASRGRNATPQPALAGGPAVMLERSKLSATCCKRCRRCRHCLGGAGELDLCAGPFAAPEVPRPDFMTVPGEEGWPGFITSEHGTQSPRKLQHLSSGQSSSSPH